MTQTDRAPGSGMFSSDVFSGCFQRMNENFVIMGPRPLLRDYALARIHTYIRNTNYLFYSLSKPDMASVSKAETLPAPVYHNGRKSSLISPAVQVALHTVSCSRVPEPVNAQLLGTQSESALRPFYVWACRGYGAPPLSGRSERTGGSIQRGC